MLVLGIETSCDETAVALLRRHADGRAELIAEEVSSQTQIHELYGGVVPELASREHMRNLPLLVDKILRDTGVNLRELGAIGVTQGPGLVGCLLMGLNFAKGLALSHGIPLVGVNHIEAHMLVARLEHPEVAFPYLALIISGGHTEIHRVTGLGNYSVVARTLDDAVGESFDKSANLLGFEYPGGPRLAALADQFRQAGGQSPYVLPKVMRGAGGFSFSGLKTAIALLVKRHPECQRVGSHERSALAHTIQEAILDALLYKLDEAVKSSRTSTVVVSGGVAANKRLREILAGWAHVNAVFPSFAHCVDNAAMIAYVAAERFARGERLAGSAEALSRWPIEALN